MRPQFDTVRAAFYTRYKCYKLQQVHQRAARVVSGRVTVPAHMDITEVPAIGTTIEWTMFGDNDHDDARTNMILVVYGNSPRSIRARENIMEALNARGIDPRTLETVDVMADPERALELRIVAAPQLMMGRLSSSRSLFGDLSDRKSLDRWLDEMLDSGDGDPSATP